MAESEAATEAQGGGEAEASCILLAGFASVLLVNSRSRFVRKEFGGEVIGKKWMYLEGNTLHWQSVGPLKRHNSSLRERERGANIWGLSFCGLSNFLGWGMEGLFQMFQGRRQGFLGIGPPPTLGLFMVTSEPMVLVGVSFSIC